MMQTGKIKDEKGFTASIVENIQQTDGGEHLSAIEHLEMTLAKELQN